MASRSVLNSVSKLTIDGISPLLNINWTVYNKTYTHTIKIRFGSTVIATITGITGSVGTYTKTIPIDSMTKNALLNAMSEEQTREAVFVLTTYDGSSQVGATGSTNIGTIETTSANSQPTFIGFTYHDSNSATASVTGSDVTGSNVVLIQSKSLLEITCTPAIPRNGASLTKYVAYIGDKKEVESSTSTISFGTITTSGRQLLTVAAIDSRGYETAVSQWITVINYTDITISSYNIRRKNNADDTIQLDFSGSFSTIKIGDVSKNTFVNAKYRYKSASATSWGNYSDISGVEVNGSDFSFTNDAWITLSNAGDYYVQITVSDKLSEHTETLYVSKGKPLMSFRDGKVGINTNDPHAPLDVVGNIKMNGFNIQGYITDLATGINLNDVNVPGIFFAGWLDSTLSQSNYPTVEIGLLEVMEVSDQFIVQRYTSSSGAHYSRVFFLDEWSEWKQLTVS